MTYNLKAQAQRVQEFDKQVIEYCCFISTWTFNI